MPGTAEDLDLGDLAAFDAVRGLRGEGLSGVTVCSVSDERSKSVV